MSALLEHFKPPPLASDPPEKTRFWPAPPTLSSGGILQRPKPVSNLSASSSSTHLSVPSEPQVPLSPAASTRVSFAPLPELTERKRRNSITLGVAARSAALRQIRERNAGAGGPPPGAAGPRPGVPQSAGGSLGRHGKPQYTYQHYQAGQPRPRRPVYKDDDVVDLGEVAMDAGKKLWRVINKKRVRSSAASDSGRPDAEEMGVGGPTVGASGHNTEREILVRGFAVPEAIQDEDDEEEPMVDEEEEQEHIHRTEDYVAGMQALQIYEDPESVAGGEFTVDPSAVSPIGEKEASSLESGHIHPTRNSPPPLTPESEISELSSSDSSAPSGITTPNAHHRPPHAYLPQSTNKSDLF